MKKLGRGSNGLALSLFVCLTPLTKKQITATSKRKKYDFTPPKPLWIW
jgi:hypothetical protein